MRHETSQENLTNVDNHHRIGRTALALAGASLGAAVAGATFATFAMSTKTHIGGAETSVTLQLGNTSQINAGGDALLGLNAPLHYGPFSAHAVIKDFGYGLQPDLDPELQAEYAQLFADPNQDRQNLQQDLTNQAVNGVIVAESLLVAGLAMTAAQRKIRAKRNPELAALLASPSLTAYRRKQRAVVATGLAATSLIVGVGQYSANSKVLQADPIFDGTALAGSELSGLLAPAVTSVVPLVANTIKQTNTYYRQNEINFQTSFEDQVGDVPDDPFVVNSLVVSDRHCNTGMNRIIKRAAELYNAPLILSAGDDSISGSFAFESACVTSLMDTVGDMATVVQSPGNHDSEITTAAGLKANMKVLLNAEPQVIDIAGTSLRIIGLADPRSSRYGQGVQPSAPEAREKVMDEAARKLVRSACKMYRADEPADIVLVHDAATAERVLDANCGVKLGVSGHTHNAIVPTERILTSNRSAYQLTEGSTGGAGAESKGGLTIAGPLLDDATMTVVSIHKITKKPVGYYTIRNHPNQTFSLSEYIPLVSTPGGSLAQPQSQAD